MISKLQIKEFEKHHAFILIFLIIALVFAANVIAFSLMYNNVTYTSPTVGAPIILANYDEVENKLQEDLNIELTELKNQIDKFVKKQPVAMGVTVLDLSSEQYIGVNDTTTFKSASMYKLFAAYETLLRVDEGSLSLNQATGYDSGSTSIDQCIRIMINVSDNDCGRALRKVLDANNNPIPRLAEIGFVGTSLMHDYPTTSAKDVTLLFDKLYRQSDLTASSNNLFMDALIDQQVNNRIPQGVPDSVTVAHKTGDLEGVSHDGGIIYAPFGDFVLVIMSGPWSNGYTEGPPVMIELTELVYKWMKTNS